MKLISYTEGRISTAGAVRDGRAIPLAPFFGRRETEIGIEDVIAVWPESRSAIARFVEREEGAVPLDSVRLLAPLRRPQKIVAIGSNYPRPGGAVGPAGSPVLFFKPPSALVGPYDPIALPPEAQTVVGEVELAIVIGMAGERIEPAAAADHIFGYMVANDVTAPEIMLGESAKNPLFLQQSRGKGFKTFCPTGPWIETGQGMPFPPVWELQQDVGEYREMHGSTRQMITGIAELLADVSCAFGLEAGDIVLTGSPPPIGGKRRPLIPGTTLRSSISGIGRLANPIVQG
ncbi:MAG: fumarylacetoacetate hydrolase family protein [Novosphingobium sp.]|nr:fumarylacetoacetate hydrolase family protein [Novosphingobium sp.]